MGKNKTSLVLEGGGLRGAYTAGALAWLIDNDITFDCGYGISTGAVYLVTFLMKSKQQLHDFSSRYINDKRIVGIKPLLKSGRIVNYDFLFDELLPQGLKFDLSPLKKIKEKGKIGVYSLNQGKTIYKSVENCDMKLLKAATSLPILGKIVDYDGEEYFDGGITDMIPIDEAVNDKCDRFLVITTKPADYVRKPAKNFVVKLMKRMYPQCHQISIDYKNRHLNYQKQISLIKELEKENKAIYVYPSRSSKVTRLSGTVEQLEELYNLGYQDMEDQKDEIFKMFK